MVPEIKHFPIHWVEGMRVSSKHFIQQEDFIHDWIRDARCILMNGQFGILPGGKPTFKIDPHPKSIRIVLQHCRAICPGGYRIELTQKNHLINIPGNMPEIEVDLSDATYYLYLSVQLPEENENGKGVFIRQEAGGAAPGSPVRFNHIMPAYQLNPGKASSDTIVSAPNQIVIGKLYVSEGNATILSEYIPPCISFEVLKEFAPNKFDFQEKLTQLFVTAQKAAWNAKTKTTGADDAADAYFLAQQISTFIASNIGDVQLLFSSESPLKMAACIMSLANIVESTFELLESKNYFKKKLRETGTEIGELKEITEGVSNKGKFYLLNLAPAFDACDLFLGRLSTLLDEISRDPFRITGPRTGSV